jgi:tol-pal system protein YbgF
MNRLWPVALVLAAATAACTSSEDMTLLHREITDVQRQVQQLEESMPDKGDLDQMEQRLQDLTSQTMRSNADLAMRVERLQEQIEALHASLELTTRRLQTISQELAAARSAYATGAVLPPVTAAPDVGGDATGTAGSEAGSSGAVPVPVPVPPATATPEELYRSSYEDYMRGNYDLAAQGFGEYMKRWPATELTDNALYWIGECYDAQDKTQEALEIFTQVLEDYPTSDKAAAAQLKKGLLYLELGDKGQGVLNLQYVVYEHPGTEEADLARERLQSLGLTIR